LGRLLEETLTDCDLQVESHGNVLAASAFLYGLALEELNREELDHHDADYDVILTVRAVKWAPASKLAEPPAQAARGRKRQAQGLILLYHRVADANVDPWLMVVAPVHFAEQMDVLQRAFQPVRLDELAQAVAHGSTQRPPVAVTFDDGYADNLYAALPILEANAVPATFFITTGGLARRSEYWWDTLERLLLWPRTLPETLQLTIAGQAFSWTLEGWGNYPEAAWAEQRQWRAWQPPPTPRHALFTALWEQLHLLPPEIRQRTLDDLAGWAQSPSEPQQRSLGLDELQRLAQSPFVEIGAHSVTHPSLARLLSEAQRREIEDSQQWLAQHLQRPIRAFTYPFGKPVDYSPETIRLVREAGFERACINTAGVIAPESDVFQWPRIHVLDWTGTEFEEALHRWLAG
jgi:peptidoglycan/xylan/chitin deacetylase (PgdA/CDA1 family)